MRCHILTEAKRILFTFAHVIVLKPFKIHILDGILYVDKTRVNKPGETIIMMVYENQ